MSGGHFGYAQYQINMIADNIEEEINRNEYESWRYPPEVTLELKEGVTQLRRAFLYAHRIDWLLSGDDGEEQFLARLRKDLEKSND